MHSFFSNDRITNHVIIIVGVGGGQVDWIIGGVVDKLKSSGVSNNTLILFTGDNGPWM